jgi:hypothetical protein
MADIFDITQIPESRRAPEGKVWRCTACGKWALDQYGIVGPHARGWDESCVLNAVLEDAGNAERGPGREHSARFRRRLLSQATATRRLND